MLSGELSIRSARSSLALPNVYILTILNIVLIFSYSSSVSDDEGSYYNTMKFWWFIV